MNTSSTPTASTTDAGYYGKSYGNKAKFLLGIKRSKKSGLYFAHGANVAGLKFVRTRQKPFLQEEADGQWMRLGTPGRYGSLRLLSFPELKAFTEKLPGVIFRPMYDLSTIERQENGVYDGIATKYGVLDLRTRRSSQDRRTGEVTYGDYTNTAGPYDIPAAHCLVLLRVSDIDEHGSRGPALPSIADLDPSLAKYPGDVRVNSTLPSVDDLEDDDDW